MWHRRDEMAPDVRPCKFEISKIVIPEASSSRRRVSSSMDHFFPMFIFYLSFMGSVALNVKRLEKFINGSFRKTILSKDTFKPFTFWSASILVEPDSLGVVTIDHVLTRRHNGTTARLVTGIVVQAHLTESRHAHLSFMGSVALRPSRPPHSRSSRPTKKSKSRRVGPSPQT